VKESVVLASKVTLLNHQLPSFLKEFLKQADQAGVAEKLNLHATFCLENCSGGSSIRINEEIISDVTVDKVIRIFQNKVINKLK